MQEYSIDAEITYDNLLSRVSSLYETSTDIVSNMANVASLLYWSLDGINWLGFYLRKGETLVLGPFHGKHACASIAMGKGVCGQAASQKKTLIVSDVRKFNGHIACDASTLSEIVVPLQYKGKVIAVLDVDSPMLERFKNTDQYFFEEVAHKLMQSIGDNIPKW
jgi:L-methionine (R)-S-oxide reductase